MIYNYCPNCGAKYEAQDNFNQLDCKTCGFTFYLNSKPTSSTLIVKDGKLLLGKRGIEPSKGKWDVIGGFLDNGEQPEDGAIREAKEETGLDVKIIETLGFFMDIYGNTDIKTLNICFIVEPISQKEKPGDDIVDLKWFSKDEIPEDIAFESGQKMIEAWLQKNT